MFNNRRRAEEREVELARFQSQLDALTDADGALSPQAYLSLGVVLDSLARASPDGIDGLRLQARVRLALGGVWLLEQPVSILLKAGELGLFEAIRAGRLVPYRRDPYVVADTGRVTLTNRRVVYHGPQTTVPLALATLGTVHQEGEVITVEGADAPQPLLVHVGPDAEILAHLIAVAREHLEQPERVVRAQDLARLVR